VQVVTDDTVAAISGSAIAVDARQPSGMGFPRFPDALPLRDTRRIAHRTRGPYVPMTNEKGVLRRRSLAK